MRSFVRRHGRLLRTAWLVVALAGLTAGLAVASDLWALDVSRSELALRAAALYAILLASAALGRLVPEEGPKRFLAWAAGAAAVLVWSLLLPLDREPLPRTLLAVAVTAVETAIAVVWHVGQSRTQRKWDLEEARFEAEGARRLASADRLRALR